MAARRYLFKCDVCGTTTLVKLQLAAWLDEHPVNVSCGHCNILMSGKAVYDHENVRVSFSLDNAEVVFEDTEDPEYQCDVSGELLTTKLSRIDPENTESFFTPFFRGGLFTMDHEGFLAFQRDVSQFSHSLNSSWPTVRRIQELWKQSNRKYLNNEILKFVPNKNVKLDSEFDYLMAVHQIVVIFLTSVLRTGEFFSVSQFIKQEIDRLVKTKPTALRDFIEYSRGIDFARKEEKVFGGIQAFVKLYRSLIPAVGLQYYQEEPDFEKMGITTATFEELKQFYQDIYEILMDILEPIIGMNNIYYRDSYSTMRSKRRDVTDLNKFKTLSKGKKLEFIDGTEKFDMLIHPIVNNDIRNAIGHAAYKYDPIQQIITYYPKAEENEDNAKKMYLAEFAHKCIHMFFALVNVWELLYHLRKSSLILDGQIPSGVNVAVDLETLVTPKNNKKKINLHSKKRKAEKAARKRNRK